MQTCPDDLRCWHECKTTCARARNGLATLAFWPEDRIPWGWYLIIGSFDLDNPTFRLASRYMRKRL